MSIKINFNEDFETILVCAIRYALGRSTYMPGLVADYVTPFVPMLSKKTLGCIEKDLSNTSNYGDENIDKPIWMELLSKVREELNKDEKYEKVSG